MASSKSGDFKQLRCTPVANAFLRVLPLPCRRLPPNLVCPLLTSGIPLAPPLWVFVSEQAFGAVSLHYHYY